MNRTLHLAVRLLGSSVLAQVAVLGATALAARRATVEDFALYGVVVSIVGVVSTFNTWAAESRLAVVDEEPARGLTRAGFTVCLIIVLISLVVAGSALAIGAHRTFVLAATSGLASFFTGLQQLITGVVLRTQRQDILARGRVVQGLSNAVLILSFNAMHWWGFVVLTVSWVISIALGNLSMTARLKGQMSGFALAQRPDWSLLFRELRAQPAANLLVSSAGALPLLILPAVGATAVSGAWALVSRFLIPAVNTMNSTLQPIFYGHLAAMGRAGDRDGLRAYHARWTTRMLMAALPVLVGTWVGVSYLVPLLGSHWIIARDVVLPAMIFYPMLFAFLPLAQTLLVVGRVDLQSWWSLARAGLCGLPFLLLPLLGAYNALVGWALAMAATSVLLVAMQRRAINRWSPEPMTDA